MFPLRRPKSPYRSGRLKAGPGQTVMLCPVERRFQVFDFTTDDKLKCTKCSYQISRKEATE